MLLVYIYIYISSIPKGEVRLYVYTITIILAKPVGKFL